MKMMVEEVSTYNSNVVSRVNDDNVVLAQELEQHQKVIE